MNEAMIDATCSCCDTHIGWYGTMRNRPACRKCGYRPSQESLDATADKIDDLRRLESLSPHKASGEELRQQRINAWLSLRQAATLIGITPSNLSSWEMGRYAMPEDMSAKVAKIYGIEPKPEAGK